MPNVFTIESPSQFILKANRKPCSKVRLNVTLDAGLNGTLTDVQNVPIDRVSDTHKLLILLMSQ